jgi:hypothetical protein
MITCRNLQVYSTSAGHREILPILDSILLASFVISCQCSVTEAKWPQSSKGLRMNISTIAPRPLPADHALLGLVALFLAAWKDPDRAGRDDYDRECGPLVAAIAAVKATTWEGHCAKGEVVQIRLLGQTMAELIEAGAEDDTALLLSFAADALALTGLGVLGDRIAA